jgi:hypothetical protein
MKGTVTMKIMKNVGMVCVAVWLVGTCLAFAEAKPAKQPVKRVGMVVGIKPDCIEQYKKLHADSNAGVRDLLTKYHMKNFSIYLQQIDGKWYEFGYYEYTGKDFEGDWGFQWPRG